MAKNYREKELEYERTGQFDRDLNDEHRTFDARDIGGDYHYLPQTLWEKLRRFFVREPLTGGAYLYYNNCNLISRDFGVIWSRNLKSRG